MRVREDRVLRRDAQEGKEVRKREEKVNRQEGEQRWEGWRNWRGEQMESFCTCRLCLQEKGKAARCCPCFGEVKKVREVETGNKEILRDIKDTTT